MVRTFFSSFILLSLASASSAQDHSHTTDATPYAGLQAREITSLSEQDIEELRRGGGWGLALPAELNGRPGPAHLLELRNEIELTPEQVARIEDIHDEMRAEAIAAGENFIAAEAALDDAFDDPDLDEERLRTLIGTAASARADLRFIHLARHLSTPDFLTPEQIHRYNALRGYSDDPCTNVPEGHDPTLWRRHNGCD